MVPSISYGVRCIFQISAFSSDFTAKVQAFFDLMSKQPAAIKATKGPQVRDVTTSPIHDMSGTLEGFTTFTVTFYPNMTPYEAYKQIQV